MVSTSSSILFLIVVILIAVYSLSFQLQASRENESKLIKWRQQENDALIALSVQCVDDRFTLSGNEAVVLSRTETIGWIGDGTRVIYLKSNTFLRNSSGEYFYWIWSSDGQNFIKHVTQKNAQIALRQKYRAP